MTSLPNPALLSPMTLIPTDLPSFRAFFASQPEETWIAGDLHSPDGTRHCAIGFLDNEGRDHNDRHPYDSPMGRALGDLCIPLFTEVQPQDRWPYAYDREGDNGNYALVLVNNGRDPRYPQTTPRARVLAALDDLIAGTVPVPTV